MMGVWSFLKQFSYTKFIIVVDHDIDVKNWSDIMWAISTQMDFGRDVLKIHNTPIDYLDFASQEMELGSKIGFDATTKIPPETKRPWGKVIKQHSNILESFETKWAKHPIFKEFK